MKIYEGIIAIGKIRNKQAPSPAKKKEVKDIIPMTESNIRFVHYPGSQQLLIWLTHPGREYGNIRLRNRKTKKIIEEWPVTDKLNGSIQVPWDSLNIAPGSYTIEIDWKNGWQHQVDIEKFKEGVIPPSKKSEVPTNKKKEKEATPIQYRDGFGKIIVDEDLVLRKKAIKDIIGKFTRHIEYEGNGRAGTVIYVEGDLRIEFSHEMGGGNCMFYIDIPTEKQWEAQTNTPLSARKDILEFVAATVRAEQASNCKYEIRDDTISFYYK